MTRPRPSAPPLSVSTHAAPGTVLAFDFGTRRIGVAVGEAALGTAHPLAPIVGAAPAARFAAIARLIEEWRPGRLVVGVARAEDGAPNETGRRAERFARQLEGRFRLPVARIDEGYSTAAAESRLREAAGAKIASRATRARALDSYAAQLILEQHFAEARP